MTQTHFRYETLSTSSPVNLTARLTKPVEMMNHW